MSTQKSGWEVREASCSDRNGGLYIHGINHDAVESVDREFHWHVGAKSIDNPRYDFSGCKFAEGAEARYRRMLEKGY